MISERDKELVAELHDALAATLMAWGGEGERRRRPEIILAAASMLLGEVLAHAPAAHKQDLIKLTIECVLAHAGAHVLEVEVREVRMEAVQ